MARMRSSANMCEILVPAYRGPTMSEAKGNLEFEVSL